MQLEMLDNAAGSMVLAMLFGAIIGMERQARQRMAGVRTNALVALGAASFVIFASLFAAEASPTRVAAQIVSGVGFLGAGLIFRDGFSVHGLNTAATLWCAAAVGMLTGAEAYPLAAMLTAVVMFINLALRPIVNWVDQQFLAGQPQQNRYRLLITCDNDREGEMRRALVAAVEAAGLRLSEVAARQGAEGDHADLAATLATNGAAAGEVALDRAVAALASEAGLHSVRWEALEQG
jgi:putative Mg2+ transporter-C (MgtC) family protein